MVLVRTFLILSHYRYVLDGWPLTKAHVDLLKKYHVLPVCLVELEISDQEMLRRAGIDKEALKKPYPLHNSSSIMLIRSGHYKKHVKDVRSWYQQQHDNWHMVDGERNKWFVWVHVRDKALHTAQQIQQYLLRVTTGEDHFTCHTYIHVHALAQDKFLTKILHKILILPHNLIMGSR